MLFLRVDLTDGPQSCSRLCTGIAPVNDPQSGWYDKRQYLESKINGYALKHRGKAVEPTLSTSQRG